MRKKWSVLLCMLLLLQLAIPIHMASAAEQTTATVSSAAVKPGEKAKIDVRLTDNPGLAAWTFEVKWDPAKITLDPESITLGEGFSNGNLLTNAREDGKLLLTWYATSDNKSVGDLFSMELSAKEGAADGVYPIEIICQGNNTINTKEEKVPVKTVAGALTVGEGKEPVKPGQPDDQPEDPEQEKLQADFSDVSKDLYCYDAVQWAVQKQVTNGITATTFAPDAVCNRGQMVTFLWRAAGCPEPKKSYSTFTDVRRGDYYEEAVLWAAENGITQGTGPNTFSPEQPVTRGQVVTLLWRQAGSEQTNLQTQFRDVAQTAYYAGAVAWAGQHQITAGTSETTFSPENPCTRGQIVTFLYRSANQ